MKKMLLFFSTLCLVLCFAFAACAEVVNVTASADVCPTYNQIQAIFIEYSEEITPMKVGDFYAIDYRTANMKEDYDRSDFGVGEISAVYTNSEPAVTTEKVDVAGKYLVIEILPCTESYYNEAEGLWKTNRNFGAIAGRQQGEQSAHFFTEGYEDLVIVQLRDAVNTEGKVVAAAGILPALTFDKIENDVYKSFELGELTNDRDYPVYFAYHLPKNYDPSKQYPLCIYQHGGGGRLNYKQQDADGNFVTRTQFARDTVAYKFVEYSNDEAIVLCPQYWRNAPWEEDGRQDNAADVVATMDYMFENFSVDREHVVAVSSSMGTMVFSEIIQRFPGYVTGYCQSNGSFMIYDTETGKVVEDETGVRDRVNCYTQAAREATVDWSLEDFWAFYRSGEGMVDASEYLAASRKALQSVIDQGIVMYFGHGINDETGSCITAAYPYELLCEMYREQGKTEAEIAKLVQLKLISNDEYHALGVNEFHEAHRYLMNSDNVYRFLMEQ